MAYDSKITGKSCPDTQADRIETLLGKYFDGATTLEEEKQLREFFTSGQPVPEELLYARAMFGYFSDAAVEAPQKGSVAAMVERTPLLQRRGMRILTAALSVAAVVTLGLLLFTGRGNVVAGDEVIYCYVNGMPVTDLDLALDYTGQALEHVSATMRAPVEDARSALDGLAGLEIISTLDGILNSNE